MLIGAASPRRGIDRIWQRRLADLEQHVDGQLGAYVLDCGSGHGFGWRADDRFAMCSSFKLSLAALVYWLADRGQLSLAERIPITPADVLENSPRTRPHVGGAMTVGELAEAAQLVSDNIAANLLLRRVGGPMRLTTFWRALGDRVSRLDHFEPQLNAVPRGGVADTTTPRAMAHTLATMLLASSLSASSLSAGSRQRLLDGMAATATGLDRIRAGLPGAWWAGDKTGTGYPQNLPAHLVDLAITRPPGRAPLIITATVRSNAPRREPDPAAAPVLADVGRLAAGWAMDH